MPRSLSSRFEKLLDEYAVRKVQKLNTEDIIEKLNSVGISNLEELVSAGQKDFATGGEVMDVFIYKHCIYKETGVDPKEILDIIEKNIPRLR